VDGYIINNLVNTACLQKLESEERAKDRDEFWEASNGLKQHDTLLKQSQHIQELGN